MGIVTLSKVNFLGGRCRLKGKVVVFGVANFNAHKRRHCRREFKSHQIPSIKLGELRKRKLVDKLVYIGSYSRYCIIAY